ncbi:TPA: hypothetical protein SI347_004719 [Escherichia coli]|nr:hypothetical protein [Escherichia coli]
MRLTKRKQEIIELLSQARHDLADREYIRREVGYPIDVFGFAYLLMNGATEKVDIDNMRRTLNSMVRDGLLVRHQVKYKTDGMNRRDFTVTKYVYQLPDDPFYDIPGGDFIEGEVIRDNCTPLLTDNKR